MRLISVLLLTAPLLGCSPSKDVSHFAGWEFCDLRGVLPKSWRLVPTEPKRDDIMPWSGDNPERFSPAGDDRTNFFTNYLLDGVVEIFMVRYSKWEGNYVHDSKYDTIVLIGLDYGSKQKAQLAWNEQREKIKSKNLTNPNPLSVFLKGSRLVSLQAFTDDNDAILAAKKELEKVPVGDATHGDGKHSP